MMPIDPAQLVGFVVASVVVIVSPGPDILFLISQGVTRGRAAGLATALGLAMGNLAHTAAAALGVSVVFRNSPAAFTALKFAGVAYLLALAVRSIRHRRERPGEVADGSPRRRSLFLRGLLMNMLNPRVALFFLTFLPQFVSPDRGAIAPQMAALGLLFVALVTVVFGAIGLFAGTAGRWMMGRAGGRFCAAATWAVAGVYVALAVWLLFSTARPPAVA